MSAYQGLHILSCIWANFQWAKLRSFREIGRSASDFILAGKMKWQDEEAEDGGVVISASIDDTLLFRSVVRFIGPVDKFKTAGLVVSVGVVAGSSELATQLFR